MMEWLKKLLGNSNDAEVKKLSKIVDQVEALEGEYKQLTDEQLRQKTDEFRARLQKGETEDDILPEAFATVREAAWRVLGMRPYPEYRLPHLVRTQLHLQVLHLLR